MPSVGFETAVSAGERPQTYVLDRTATGTDPQPHHPQEKPRIPHKFGAGCAQEPLWTCRRREKICYRNSKLEPYIRQPSLYTD
jgi:hypothetical protein